ncbi:MAG: DNA replication/repair protein RecF [bacterium]
MRITALQVSQFRCWIYREISLPEQVVYLKGPNGSGKTSLLEAIRYLSSGRSFQTHRNAELVRWGANSFTVRGEFVSEDNFSPEEIAVSYDSRQKSSRVKVNSRLIPRLSELQGLFPTVLFTPRQTEIISGSPASRREFLDQLLCQLYPRYLENLQKYKNSLSQRNALLKRSNPDPMLLEEYEKQMSESATVIISERHKILQMLKPLMETELIKISNRRLGEIELNYQPGISKLPVDTSLLTKEFEKERKTAVRRGYTTIGPQRDDWQLKRSEGHSLHRYVSRGELKMVLIALKTAEARCIMEIKDEKPVMLFDDLLSELDDSSRLNSVTAGLESRFQLIFTGTEQPYGIDCLKSGSILEIGAS